MCGIIAIWSREQPVGEQELRELTDCLKHRGPDGEGTLLVTPQLGLGHRRLAIIDLSPSGRQPMKDLQTGNVVTYNGELYNYKELKKELEGFGHVFRSTSDTEVLLKAYAQWGMDCLKHFYGMFAFVLWDAKKQALWAARDRLGIKPLYWVQDNERVIIASELKSLQPYLKTTKQLRLNENALAFYLTMRSVPTDDMLMSPVKRLGAGQTLWFERPHKTPEQTAYWRLSDHSKERPADEGEALNELETLLRRAVKRRLVADVPVGCFLSGGVDSSLVTLFAAQESQGKPVHSFSVDFEEAAYSERVYFDHVAEAAKTEHHVFSMNARTFLDFLTDWVVYMDDLVSDPSSLPLYFVAKEAQRHNIKVVLSGEGADELLGGYDSYLQMIRLNPLRGLARWAPWAGLLSGDDRRDLWNRLAGNHPFRGTAYVFGESLRSHYLKKDISLEPWVHHIYGQPGTLGLVNQMLYFDMATRIPSDLLIRTDRVTMAASIECRVPFLDHELVESMLGLAGGLKIKNGTGKYILKKLALRYLPENFVFRPKVGFNVPLNEWFQKELTGMLDDIFFKERRIQALNYPAIQELIKEHRQGRFQSAKIWNLLALELWHRRWINA
ncbi:MAG: asparagine synthase (glutamine-hydrolyzing) [Elusimicrobia bacterium]|nr:asparagine synthase (glutamine-hydrolyzing) [Elusimicrobiota bacterium]